MGTLHLHLATYCSLVNWLIAVFDDLNLWMLHNVLLLNPAKTEAIKLIFASQQEMLNALTQTR
jgi:hypothetical protein